MGQMTLRTNCEQMRWFLLKDPTSHQPRDGLQQRAMKRPAIRNEGLQRSFSQVE
jgi:hypothetical protein